MRNLLIISLLFISVQGWLNFNDYKKMCNIGPNCYSLFSDTDKFYRPARISMDGIDLWPQIRPNSSVPANIGWAQAHAMVATYSHRLYQEGEGVLPDRMVFQVLSIIKLGLENSWINCSSPFTYPYNLTKFLHLPFISVPKPSLLMYSNSTVGFNYDSNNPTQWCDLKYLKSVNVGPTSYSRAFTGYTNYQVTKFDMYQWSVLFRGFGMALVGIPNDRFFSVTFGYYPDGFYRLTGPILYYYPAVVVGVYMNSTNTYLIAYAFGAGSPDTNYLYVDINMISIPGWVTIMNQIF